MKMEFRRIISFALAVCLCLAVLPPVAAVPVQALTPTYTVSSSYKASSFYSALLDVKLTGNQRDDIIAVALSQVGYREGSYDGDYGGADDGSYLNYVEYNYWYHNYINSGMPVGGSYAHWCATFVSWCAEQANVPKSILNRSTAAGHSSSYFNIYFYSGSSTLNATSDNNYHFLGYNYTPKKGDLFYTRTWSHVGLVVAVNGSYVTTVEGNTNDGGSADGMGVYVRTRAISSLYFGVPEYEDNAHTCDAGQQVSYEAAHPHNSIYQCSVCGNTWTDTESSNVSTDCITCQQPGTPAWLGMNANYADDAVVSFTWTPAENVTHYNILLEKQNSYGQWEQYELMSYASNGMGKLLPVGSYRSLVQAYNSNYWSAEQSDWIHTQSDYTYFTVSRAYTTITFDANQGYTSIASRTVLYGQPIGELPIPERSGYEFTGWYLTLTGDGNPVQTSMVPEDDMILYARWEKSVIIPVLSLSYPSLAFDDEIRYNIYYNVDDTTSVEEMGMAIYAYPNSSGTVANALEVIPGYVANASGNYTVSTNGIPAKMLGQDLHFKVYAKLADGSYVYSKVASYSAKTYAQDVLSSNANAKSKALMVAMLNYAAAAQMYFNYNIGNLANASLTADQKALVKAYDTSMIGSIASVSSTKSGQFVMNGFSNIYPSVSFEGAFSINYYFTPKYVPEGGITFYYWTASDFNAVSVLTPSNATGAVNMSQSGSNYIGVVEDIAAKAVNEPVYIAAAYLSGGRVYTSLVIGYSLGTYCSEIAAAGTEFGAATAVYGYYAKAYFTN